MKRDIDLIRKLLLDIEERTDCVNAIDIIPERYAGHTEREIINHLILLEEAGMVTGIKYPYNFGDQQYWKKYSPTGLTWQGHEFLEASRNATIWKKAKKVVLEKTGGLSIEILKGVLIALAKQEL